METTPQNLTPMESVLLDSLQRSATEHEQRLRALEELLKQLTEQSSTSSESDRSTVSNLVQQLERLHPALQNLSERVEAYRAEAATMTATYNRAVEAFNSMKAQYTQLASEVSALRALAD